MYHYTECGLRNVWLANGYHKFDTPYGKGVSVDDTDELHRLIGTQLVNNKPHLTGPEFRFLRHELDVSQKRLASILGNNEQAIARWEKQGRVPKWADRLMRLIYEQVIGGNPKFTAMVDRLNDLDQQAHADKKMQFGKDDGHWKFEAHAA